MTPKELLASIPDAARLVARLARDGRVPVRARMAAGFAALYAIVPVDLVPDRLRALGRVDDALVLALGLHVLLESAGDDVIAEHWNGSDEALTSLRSGLESAVHLVPARVRRSVLGVAAS